MNKFKKILLGTLSVLTLGLFVATGARVDAAKNYIINAADSHGSANSTVIYEKSSTTNHSSQNGFTLLMPNNAGKYYSLTYDSTATDVIITKTFTLKSTNAVTVTFNMTASSASGVGNKKTLTMTSDKKTLTDNVLTSADAKMQSWTYTYSENETITIEASGYAAIKNIYYETADISSDENASTDLNVGLSLDPTKLKATADREVLTASEAAPFEIFETSDDVKKDFEDTSFYAQKRGATVYGVEFKNGGLKFTTNKASTLTLTASSTSNSNTSYFAVFNSNRISMDATGKTKNATYTDYYTVSTATEFIFTLSTAGTYYIEFDVVDSSNPRGGQIRSLNVGYAEQSVKLQRQVSTDKTAIRFIATLEGFDSTLISQIESITYTFKVTGYKAFNKNVTSVYKSIANKGTVILAEKDNTYYCSYMFTDLLTTNGSATLVGKNITAYLTITINGTNIVTNSVGYDIVAAE